MICICFFFWVKPLASPPPTRQFSLVCTALFTLSRAETPSTTHPEGELWIFNVRQHRFITQIHIPHHRERSKRKKEKRQRVWERERESSVPGGDHGDGNNNFYRCIDSGTRKQTNRTNERTLIFGLVWPLLLFIFLSFFLSRILLLLWRYTLRGHHVSRTVTGETTMSRGRPSDKKRYSYLKKFNLSTDKSKTAIVTTIFHINKNVAHKFLYKKAFIHYCSSLLDFWENLCQSALLLRQTAKRCLCFVV